MSGCAIPAADGPYKGIPFARHVRYSTRVPGVGRMVEEVCKGYGADSIIAARHEYYTAGGFPVLAQALACCNHYDPRPRVATGCYAPGITQTLFGFVQDAGNCPEADDQQIEFNWNAGASRWEASMTLSGGALTFELTCSLDFLGRPQFTLTWSGCAPVTGTGTVTCSPLCSGPTGVTLEPLLLAFNLTGMSNCCACGSSVAGASFNLYIVGNCQPVVKARHVGYTAAGVPIVAQDNYCPWTPYTHGCCYPTCGLSAVVTNVSGCACMAGSYILSFNNPGPPKIWNGGTPGPLILPCHFSIDLQCEEVVDVRGCAKLTLSISCLSVDPPDPPQQDVKYVSTMLPLDETFTIPMSASNCCSGVVTVRVMR